MTRWRRFVWNATNRLRYESLSSNAWFITKNVVLPLGRAGLYLIYCKDLTELPEPVHAKVPIEVKEASAAECDEAARLDGGEEAHAERLRAWLHLGHKCFVAKAGPEVVAAGWLGFREMQQISFSVVLNDDEAYITGAHTAKTWRGEGIHSELEYWRIHYARSAGCRSIYVAVSVDNDRSGRSFRRRGWKLSGVVLLFRHRGASTPRVWCIRGSPHPVVPLGSRGRVSELQASR